MRLSPLSAAIYRLSLCLIALCGTMAAHAATLNVGPGQPYTTIQSAIDASTNGDTIVVAPGTYYENIDFKGKAITVTSGATSYLGSSGTIIDGSKGIGFAVTFQGNETAASVINGFTIQNATGGKSSNVFLSSGGVGVINGTPTISNNTFTHNLCNAIYSEGSPLIVGNEIDNTLDIQGHCTFGAGSAIWLEGSLVSPNARVVGNLIQNNTQSSHEDAGGNGGSGVAVWAPMRISPAIPYGTTSLPATAVPSSPSTPTMSSSSAT